MLENQIAQGQTGDGATVDPTQQGGAPPDQSGTAPDDSAGVGSAGSGEDAELTALRQKAAHADRAIADQGRANAQLRGDMATRDTEVESLRQTVQLLQGQILTLGQQQRAPAPNDDTYYDGAGNAQAGVTAAVPEDYDLVRRGVRELAASHGELQNAITEMRSSQQTNKRQETVDGMVSQFGISQGDADLVLQAQERGDTMTSQQLLVAASSQAAARTERRTEVQAQRDVAQQMPDSNAAPVNSQASSAAPTVTDQAVEKVVNDNGGWQSRMKNIMDNVAADPKFLDKLGQVLK